MLNYTFLGSGSLFKLVNFFWNYYSPVLTVQFLFLFSDTYTFDKHHFDVFLPVIHDRAELGNGK